MIKKIKRINIADSFAQLSLIIFTKGAIIFGHDCTKTIIKKYFSSSSMVKICYVNFLTQCMCVFQDV